jgi:hypothetical protein
LCAFSALIFQRLLGLGVRMRDASASPRAIIAAARIRLIGYCLERGATLSLCQADRIGN